MQKIGEQITIEKTKETLRAVIVPILSKQSKLFLNLWVLGWTLCGLAVIAQLVLYADEFERNQIMFLVGYLSFWAYLEYKILYAFNWNRIGQEVIEIEGGTFSYTKLIGKRGLALKFDVSKISKFNYEQSTEKGILNDINRAPWMVAGEVIQYNVDSQIKRLGLKLSKQDAEKLSSVLNKYVTK